MISIFSNISFLHSNTNNALTTEAYPLSAVDVPIEELNKSISIIEFYERYLN